MFSSMLHLLHLFMLVVPWRILLQSLIPQTYSPCTLSLMPNLAASLTHFLTSDPSLNLISLTSLLLITIFYTFCFCFFLVSCRLVGALIPLDCIDVAPSIQWLCSCGPFLDFASVFFLIWTSNFWVQLSLSCSGDWMMDDGFTLICWLVGALVPFEDINLIPLFNGAEFAGF